MLAASKPIEKPPMPEKISSTFNILVYYSIAHSLAKVIIP
jgi:hypothetical protein